MRERDGAKRADLFEQMDEIYSKMDPGLVIFFQRSDPYVIPAECQGLCRTHDLVDPLA